MDPDGALASLEVIEGSRVGSRYPITTEPMLIGRGSWCQIQIEDPKASREHARIIYEQGRLMLNDQGSANGLRVNGKYTKSINLDDGDLIQIGDTVLRLQLSADVVPTVLDPDRNLTGISSSSQDQASSEKPGKTQCNNCGSPFSPGERFCGTCGAQRLI